MVITPKPNADQYQFKGGVSAGQTGESAPPLAAKTRKEKRYETNCYDVVSGTTGALDCGFE